MLKWLMRSQLKKFERTYGYDAAYVHAILDADAAAFMKLGRAMGMGHYRKGVPKEAWYAAKIVGAMAEDCGPCTQLCVVMAERDGVAPELVRAVVMGHDAELTEPVRLVVAFTRASLAHSLDADAYRDQIVAAWGPRGLVSVAFAMTMARLYPTLKYALGHGKACARIVVAGQPVIPLRAVAA